MTAVVLRGDAGACLPLPESRLRWISIVTSPPFWAASAVYTDGGGHYDGQIGSEATPGEWVEALWRARRSGCGC